MVSIDYFTYKTLEFSSGNCILLLLHRFHLTVTAVIELSVKCYKFYCEVDYRSVTSAKEFVQRVKICVQATIDKTNNYFLNVAGSVELHQPL